MKLLPRFTSYIKDAAKSVKRISLQEFKEVADETLTELLGIASIVVKMCGAKRPLYIFSLAVSNAKIVAELL